MFWLPQHINLKMCFIGDKQIFVHMSHARQRQSTIVQKKKKKKKSEETLFWDFIIKKIY